MQTLLSLYYKNQTDLAGLGPYTTPLAHLKECSQRKSKQSADVNHMFYDNHLKAIPCTTII